MSKQKNTFDELKSAIENQLNWGPSSDWHSAVFQELSDKIFEQCQVMLSAATLKRFFGTVQHQGKPSINTLDTLCRFVGFENWREFKTQHGNNKTQKPKLALSAKSYYVSIGFVFALFMIFMIANTRPEEPVDFSKVTFASRPVTNTYPNSVVFDFDLDEINSDSILIQQYWDPTKTIRLTKNQKQATGIYYFPGYFRAKLVVDGNSIKEHNLFLKSQGWLGTIEYEPVPKYFIPGKIGDNGLIYDEQISEEIKTSDSPLVSVYHFINDLGEISADNFNLKSKLKIDFSEKWAVCQTAFIYIIGTQGAMIIPVSKIGCSSDNMLMLCDEFYSGKQHDLSAFAADLTQLTDTEIDVRQQEMRFSINDQVIYSQAYQKSMGQLVGIRYKFLGLGTVADYELRDEYNNIVLLDR